MTALHAQAVRDIEKRWNKSTSVFTEKDSTFAPAQGMFTVAQHVAHVAQDVDWFIAGAFRKGGFDMDFEAMKREILKVKSLKAARAWMKRACAKRVRGPASKSVEEMDEPIAGPLVSRRAANRDPRRHARSRGAPSRRADRLRATARPSLARALWLIETGGPDTEVQKTKSLKAARAWMKRACAKAVRVLKAKSREEMQVPITGPLMTGEPRIAIMTAMTDHTAHHRGSLAVYARLLGRVSPMPYM